MIKNKKCEKVNHSLITKYKVFTNKKHENKNYNLKENMLQLHYCYLSTFQMQKANYKTSFIHDIAASKFGQNNKLA